MFHSSTITDTERVTMGKTRQEQIEKEIEEIEEEIRETPYNKSTEQHIGRLKAKLSKLKEELESYEESKGGGGGYGIKSEGDATIGLVGLPSVGKSTLLNNLTDAKSEVAGYHFTTLEVIPGIMKYNNAEFQILDLPGLIEGASSGKGRGKEILSVVRNVDLVILLADIYRQDISTAGEELESQGIRLNKEPPEIVITERDKGGIDVNSTVELTRIDEDTIREILREYGYINANIVIRDDIGTKELIDHLSDNRVYMSAFSIMNKVDLLSDEEREELKNKDWGDWSPTFVSAKEGEGLEEIKERIFEKLELVRIFLKPKGEKADNEPMIIKKGSTIEDVCKKLHSDFIEKFRYARIWGPTAKFPKQRVGLDHELEEGDTVRIITR